MAETSNIEWTDATWNPWQGCTKVSPACQHCYMFADLKRYGRDGSIVVRSKPPTFNLPMKKRRGGQYAIPPGWKVFTCSWSDWFHERADPWRAEAWAIIRQRADVIFQIVTKRTERIATCLPDDWGSGYPNVWLTATVENQEWADKRIPELVQIPATIRGLSIEPMLGPINLDKHLWPFDELGRAKIEMRSSPEPHGVRKPLGLLHWVIVGGESGHGARPMHPDWVRSLRDQCVASDTAFFFKQWGEFAEPQQVVNGVPVSAMRHAVAMLPRGRVCDRNEPIPKNAGAAILARPGKELAGRMLDGRTWDEFPIPANRPRMESAT
jgi:protein gp37